MSKKSPTKIKRLYGFKTPPIKTIRAIITGIDTAERQLREGEKKMAQREQANMRPLTMKQINENIRFCSRQP